MIGQALCLLIVVLGCSDSSTVRGENRGSGIAPGGFTAVSDIYEQAKHSVVFVETPDATGSGVVADSGWIITNAHVVGRHPQVRLVGGAGQDLGDHPVVIVDNVLDLALVGPVEDEGLRPFERVDEDIEIGAPVLLIGYPDEVESNPSPTVTTGVLSRRRFVGLAEARFLQVDSMIAPGQSGGALLDERGQLAGISGLMFGHGGFGLALSADFLWPRIDVLFDRVLEGQYEPLPAVEDSRVFAVEVGPRNSVGFLAETDSDGLLHVRVDSSADVYIEAVTLGGAQPTESTGDIDYFSALPEVDQQNPFRADSAPNGSETLEVHTDVGAYVVIVGAYDESAVSITGYTPLALLPDAGEGAYLRDDQVHEGAFDWIGDSDRWLVDLSEGDAVTIEADGIADTVLVVRHNDEVVVSSDDDGFGLYGTGSQVSFIAPATGPYLVDVGTYDDEAFGYFVGLRRG